MAEANVIALNRAPNPEIEIRNIAKWLRTVGPGEGRYCLAHRNGTSGAFKHRWFDSLYDLAAAALDLSTAGDDIWFALARFDNHQTRETIHALGLRALFIDVDVKDGAYLTLDAARDAVQAFESEFLPATTKVLSGGGLHIYWAFEKDLSVSQWRHFAQGLKAIAAAHGLIADYQCTVDAARIARVPGTMNLKLAETPRPVLIEYIGELVTIEAVQEKLSVCEKAARIRAKGSTRALKGVGENFSLNTGGDNSHHYVAKLPPEKALALVRSTFPFFTQAHLNNYGEWLANVAAIKSIENLTDADKYQLAVELSGLSRFWNDAGENELEEKWSQPELGKRTNIGALLNRAKATGWKRPAETHPSRFASVADFHTYLNEEGWALVCGGRGEREYIAPNNHAVSVESFGDLFNTRMPDGKGAHLLATREGGVVKVDSVIYRPGRDRFFCEHGCDYVNTWRECRHVAIEPTKDERKIFWRPIKHLMAGDLETQKGITWFLRLLAWKQQHRDERIPVFPILIGETEGSGKSTLFYDLAVAALGAENVGNINNAEVSSSFTDWVGEKEWIVLHEMKINNHKEAAQIANSLKTIVTDKMVRQVRKGKSGRTIVNISTYVGTSNHMDAAHLSDSDRRYFAIHTKALRMSMEIAKPWHDLLESVRGPGIVRYELEKLDISGFDPYAPPMESEARRRMMAASRTDVEDAVFTAYENGEGCFTSDIVSKKYVTALVREKVGCNIAERSVLNALEKYCDSKSKRIAARDNDDKVEKPWVYFIRNHGKWQEATGAEQMAEYKRGLSAQLLM